MNHQFDYEKKISGQKARSLTNRLKPNYLLAEIRQVKGRVLDIGCGAGQRIGQLKQARPDLTYFGVDISKHAIQLAKKDWLEINFQVASTYQLPYADNYFQVVTMHNVLEHLDHPKKALEEVYRVLKPGGLFYCLTPLEGEKWIFNPPAGLARKFHGHVQRFTQTQLQDLFKITGFTISRRYYSGYILCQLIGVGYCKLWEWGQVKPDFSLSGHIQQEKSLIKKTLISFIQELTYLIINLESLIIPRWVPGYYIHLIVKKKIPGQESNTSY